MDAPLRNEVNPVTNTDAPTTEHEAVVSAIRALDRHRLVHELLNFKGALRLDFTEEFLNRLSDEKLRHILLAAHMYGRPYRPPGQTD